MHWGAWIKMTPSDTPEEFNEVSFPGEYSQRCNLHLNRHYHTPLTPHPTAPLSTRPSGGRPDGDTISQTAQGAQDRGGVTRLSSNARHQGICMRVCVSARLRVCVCVGVCVRHLKETWSPWPSRPLISQCNKTAQVFFNSFYLQKK